MENTGICECGCSGKTDASKRSGRPNKFIRGHNRNNGDRIKAAMLLGHPIPKGVEVHHHCIPGKNGSFERTSQLVVCGNHKYHCYLHIRQRAYFNIKVYRATVAGKRQGAGFISRRSEVRVLHPLPFVI